MVQFMCCWCPTLITTLPYAQIQVCNYRYNHIGVHIPYISCVIAKKIQVVVVVESEHEPQTLEYMCVNNPSFLVIQIQWIEIWFLTYHVAKYHNAIPNNHVVVHGILCAYM